MNTYNIQFHDKIRKFPELLVFLKNFVEFELTMVNEPSVFEPSRFDCRYLFGLQS